MNKKISATLLLAAAFGAALYASPYFALHQIKTAVQERDADALAKRIDFPALRENLKTQMMTAMSDRMNTPAMAGNPFAAMGRSMATAMAGPIIDAMVSPEGIMALMRNTARQSGVPQEPGASHGKTAPDYALSYQGWDKVRLRLQADQESHIDMILRRDGLWHWKLTAMEMPAGALGKL